jgi:hypothetical protein
MNLPRHWIKPLARAGYSARGTVYVIIGLFALLAAIGSAESKDSKGALEKLLEQPFGTVIVWLLIVGLAGYVIWRLIQSVFDTDDHGLGPKGLAIRGGLLASAITYATLAVFALSLIGVFSGGGSGSDGGESGGIAAWLTDLFATRWIALVLAATFAGVAGAHFWKAWTRKYEDHIDADSDMMSVIHPISMAGLAARGVIFLVIAILFAYRFLGRRQDEAGHGETPGLKDALGYIQDLPAGGWLLAAIGLGLIAFSAYSFIEARWRRINVEDA